MFAKKKPARTCDKGHPLEQSWERCPYCEAEKGSPSAGPAASATARDSTDELPELPRDVRDAARRPVLVPRRAAPEGLPGGWLVALSGEQAGRDFRLDHGRNVLGKSADCAVAVKDAQASERHVLIEVREGGEVTLEDLGSRHGTLVNGEAPSGRVTLHDGDRIRLGQTELVFRAFRVD